MANKRMKTLQLPGLSDVYTFVQADSTLTQAGEAADAKVTGDKVSELKSALPSFAPNSTVVSDGEPIYVTKRTDAAWYRTSSSTVGNNSQASGILSVCIALADIAESVIIDYSDFSGSGSQNALIMAEGAELGSTIDHYWGAKPSSNFGGYGSINGNLVTVKKSLVAQTSPNTTHLFINISATSGSIKNVLWSNPESVIEIAHDAKETADIAEGKIDYLTRSEYVTPTIVSSGYKLAANGSCLSDADYKLVKYAVTAGDKIWAKGTLDGAITMQFQTDASVPYTTNPNLVGEPIRETVDGVYVVPNGATYVIFCALVSNETSGLYSVYVNQAEPSASLPAYWQTYLSSKAADIDAAIASVGNHGDYFSFFTDYHINSNQQHTSLILKTIREAHRIAFDVFGGDALTNHTKANALQFLHKFESDFEHSGFFPLVGNHEKNPYNNAEDVLTDDDIYPILFKRLEKDPKVSLRPRMYYRIDNGTQSIRYLFLNTDTASNGADWYLDSAQIQWLENELNSTPEGWYVVIFTHMFYSNSTGTEIDGIGTLLKRICNAFQSRTTYTSTSASHTFDFTNAKGKMCAIITGHVHADYADTSNAYPIIATICDTNQAQQQPSGSTVDRTTGTINEQAIDLFFIDTTAKTIDTIRIGAGSDRSFTFA